MAEPIHTDAMDESPFNLLTAEKSPFDLSFKCAMFALINVIICAVAGLRGRSRNFHMNFPHTGLQVYAWMCQVSAIVWPAAPFLALAFVCLHIMMSGCSCWQLATTFVLVDVADIMHWCCTGMNVVQFLACPAAKSKRIYSCRWIGSRRFRHRRMPKQRVRWVVTRLCVWLMQSAILFAKAQCHACHDHVPMNRDKVPERAFRGGGGSGGSKQRQTAEKSRYC
jgi:hypothetical protein